MKGADMPKRGPEEIDLLPNEYKVKSGKRKEPILGEQWYVGVAYFVGFTIAIMIVHLWRG